VEDDGAARAKTRVPGERADRARPTEGAPAAERARTAPAPSSTEPASLTEPAEAQRPGAQAPAPPPAQPPIPEAPAPAFEPFEPWPAVQGDGPEPVVVLEPELEGEDLPDTADVIELLLPEEEEEEETEPASPEPRDAPAVSPESVARLAKAVAHEVRNPLVSIRTFSDLLHDHYADADFRDRFGSLVAKDVRRIEEVIERLEQMGEVADPRNALPVDMTELLEGLLDEQRANIQAKRLLVLKELDRARPEALGDARLLRMALAGLLDRAIEEAPDRGDLYLASRHRPDSDESATMRILIRYRVTETPSDSDLALETFRATNLEAEVAQAVIERQGGALRIDMESPSETLVVIDLPASPAPR
jgi:hypothetical protein